MFNREIVMSKKEKFRKIASQVFDIVGVTNYFRLRMKALRADFNEQEKETHATLWRVYMNGLTPTHENNPEYDTYIELVMGFVKNVVEKYVPIEQRKHGNGSDFTTEHLERYLKYKEIEDWKKGSKFVCVLNDSIHVRRIPLETNEDGKWKNHLTGSLYTYLMNIDFRPEVSGLEMGLYEVVNTGERFDIRNAWGPLSMEIPFHLKETHSVVREFEKDLNEVDLNDRNKYKDDTDDYECPRCRGGGCPLCDTTGFFTGIPVY